MKFKKFVGYLAVGLILISSGGILTEDFTVYAASATPAVNVESAGITFRAEQTEWHYRIVDGALQKRLWSITYAKWLTDWEWV